jgi:hypothetical protein
MNHRTESKENIERCAKIFISWQWGMVAIFGLIVIIASLAFSQGVDNTNIKRDIKMVQEKVDVITKMSAQMDSIIKYTRPE